MEQTPASIGAGDRTEWNALIGSYLSQLKRFATRRLPAEIRRTIGAEDLVQDAVMSGIKQLDRFEFRHEQALLAYLLTSIRHRIVDEVRRTRRQPALVSLAEDRDVDESVSPLEQVITRENMERYVAALRLLSARDRQLIVLRLERRLPYLEIAARLGMRSEASVRMAVRRALQRLEKKVPSRAPAWPQCERDRRQIKRWPAESRPLSA